MQNTMILEQDTPYLLFEWAKWARCGNDSVSYPSVTSVSALIGGSIRQAMITDDQAMRVDQAVGGLKARDKEAAQALEIWAHGDGNISLVARVMRIDRRRAEVLVHSGTAWVDCRLCGE